ncbi:hypothetical protein [Rhodococcus sp. NPDC006774]|uniref:hypothetical protein n=1 Tax=Rhodococcus sp. NPDC006774 TaxID=3157186 RepID=UPI0033E9E7DE
MSAVDVVLDELRNELNTSIVSTLLASHALGYFADEMRSWDSKVGRHPLNIWLGDPTVHFNDAEDPESPDADRHTPSASILRSEALRMMALRGPIEINLSQSWIVSFYARWEEHFRKRLADAHGCDVEAVICPPLGDLRHLRNLVVHNGGEVDSRWRRSQVFSHWFEVGETIYLRGHHFLEFEQAIPWEALKASTT